MPQFGVSLVRGGGRPRNQGRVPVHSHWLQLRHAHRGTLQLTTSCPSTSRTGAAGPPRRAAGLTRRFLRVLARESFRVIAGPGIMPGGAPGPVGGRLTGGAAVAWDAGQRAITGTCHGPSRSRPCECTPIAQAAVGPPAPGLRRILYAIGCRILRGNDASGFVGPGAVAYVTEGVHVTARSRVPCLALGG